MQDADVGCEAVRLVFVFLLFVIDFLNSIQVGDFGDAS